MPDVPQMLDRLAQLLCDQLSAHRTVMSFMDVHWLVHSDASFAGLSYTLSPGCPCNALQVEVFQELNAKRISVASATRTASRANSSTFMQSGTAAVAVGSPPAPQAESIFVSQDDRHLLLSLLLHCADIGNSVKPWLIAKK